MELAGLQVGGSNQGNAIPALQEFRPDERHGGKPGFQPASTGPDFQGQQASWRQKASGMVQDSCRGFHPVGAGHEREPRFVAVLGREARHVRLGHVGWIGDDQVEGALESREQVRLDEVYPVGHTVPLDIHRGYRKRVHRDVRGDHAAGGKGQCQRNGNAATARADLEDAMYSGRLQPRLEAAHDEFREGRPGDQHALVDMERQAGEPGLTRQVWQRATGADAQLNQGFDPAAVGLRDRRAVGLDRVPVVETEHVEHERGSLVPRVLRTVAEKHPRLIEAGSARADHRGHRVGCALPAIPLAGAARACRHPHHRLPPHRRIEYVAAAPGIPLPMLASLLDQLFVLFQRLLPERQLGRAVHAITRNRTPWLRTLLIRAFVRLYRVDLADVEHPQPEAWEHLNAFFTRPLRPGARPVAPGDRTIVSPSDGTLEYAGYAEAGLLLQAKRFRYRIADFLALEPTEAEQFGGGATATIYLAPHDYHRVHMPLAGRVTGTVYVPGRRWAVNRRTVRTVPGLFAANERVIVWCENEAGRFAVVLVGALNVASISLAWSGPVLPAGQVVRTSLPQADAALNLPAGGLLGQFNLGSTVVIVAQRNLIQWDGSLVTGGPVRMGARLGQSGNPGSG